MVAFSVQSCFPEIRSNATESSFKDDLSSISVDCSHTADDEISLKDIPNTAFTNKLQRQLSCPALLFDFPNPNLQLSNSIDFPEVEPIVTDVVLDVALWPCNQEVNSARWNCFTPYVPLHLAALKGDWSMAREFLALNPQAVRARMTLNFETALHIAAGAGHTKFVQELVKLMTPDELALTNKVGNTALCFAAVSGITSIAEVMVSKNERLPSIRGSNRATPLCMAALLGHRDMVWYLYYVTNQEDLTEKDRIELLVATINSDLYDVALYIIQHHPELALARDGNGETALHVLARKPLAFPSGTELGIWKRCIYSSLHVEQLMNSHSTFTGHGILSSLISKVPGIKAIFETKLRHIQAIKLVEKLWEQVLLLDDSKIGELLRKPSRLLFIAAELGNVDFIIVLIRMYPGLIWKVDDQSRSIFHIAVLHRQEKIFRLIYEIGAHKDLIAAYKDENINNMLHLAGKLAPPNRLKTDSGAALQLRRELQWFKEVEKIVQPSYREMKNSEGRTPYILFTDEHKGLVREGEKWMKDTASSCMVVATLIATVMFAAAFTVPGGNNNDTGMPIFLHYRSFIVFSISNALALFSAATSILMFLSIITSRYAEEDFLDSLPKRLVMGLATLFISIATMMVAFSATLFIILGHDFACIAIPIATMACVPVALFALLQFPLFADMITHLYSSSICFHPCNHLLY